MTVRNSGALNLKPFSKNNIYRSYSGFSSFKDNDNIKVIMREKSNEIGTGPKKFFIL